MLLNKRCLDKSGEMEYMQKSEYSKMEMDPMMGGTCCDNQYPGVTCPPVYECPQVRCCHREIFHEVPHIIPVETRIINHHIYRHTYTPAYSCCEENEVSNVYDNKCCY